jgi:hypothetical protein
MAFTQPKREPLVDDFQAGIDKLKSVFVKKEEVSKAQEELQEMQREIGLWGFGEDTYMPYRIEQSFYTIFGDDEKLANKAYETCLGEDSNMAKAYFQYYRSNYTYRNENPSHRKAAFSCILNNAEYIWKLIEEDKEVFKQSELKMIYSNNSKELFKNVGKGVQNLFLYCSLFKEYINEEEKDLLIKRILGRKKIDFAKVIINEELKWNLSKEQRGILDGLLVAEKLRKAK